MEPPDNNSNTRKWARVDQNSNIHAMETPLDVHVRARHGQPTGWQNLAETGG